MVQCQHDGRSTIWEAIDPARPPQRLSPIEWGAGKFRRDAQQGILVRRGQTHGIKMAVQIEGRIIEPHWAAEPGWKPVQTLTQPWHPHQPTPQQIPDDTEADVALQFQYGGDVHRRRPTIAGQRHEVIRAEPFGVHPDSLPGAGGISSAFAVSARTPHNATRQRGERRPR